MPSEHYDILSNLEKDINDNLIKEYNKKMVYLKNNIINTLPTGATDTSLSYNPYYNETIGDNIQVFNTELNNVIINTGSAFKYKYNFQTEYTDIIIPSGITVDYILQHSFVMNETLYYVSKANNDGKITIKTLWSFNPNVKIINYDTNIYINGANYYTLYAYPYVIIYGRNNNSQNVLYYSINLLYWQTVILSANMIYTLKYINNKNIISFNDVQYTQDNMLMIQYDINNYYIYPSFTKEELFMRM